MAALGESLTALDVYNKCAGASALNSMPVLSLLVLVGKAGLLGREFTTADGKQLKLSSLAGVPAAVNLELASCSGSSLSFNLRLPCGLTLLCCFAGRPLVLFFFPKAATPGEVPGVEC